MCEPISILTELLLIISCKVPMTVSGQTLPLSSDTTGNAFDQATSWADLVTGASRSHQIMNLNYIEPVSSEGGVRVSPAPAVVVQGSKD